MKRIVVFGTGIGLALAAAATAVAADKPKVEAVGAEELRTAGENGTGSSSAQEPRLTVVLRIDGLDQPARFGRVVIAEAKDDAGTDLRPKDDDAEKEGDQKLTELPNVTRPVGSSTVEDVPKAFYVRVRLRPSARQARRIASLKGEIRVAAGGDAEKPAVITIPGVKALRGKTVDNPELARAGVTVQVGRQGPQDD